MSVLMIHEMDMCKVNYLQNNPNNTLIFDDALYSQFYYWPFINRIKVKKIIAVSPNLLLDKDIVRDAYIVRPCTPIFASCYEALKAYRTKNDRQHYMTLPELKLILDNSDVELAAHGFNHLDIRLEESNIKKRFDILKEDTDKMLNWFDDFGYKPTTFVFPHNYDYALYKSLLKSKGFKTFYGKERIPIEEVI